MTAQAIQNPFPTFADSDGQPLEGGYVYFGSEAQDPRTNPVTVYYDEAMTVTATQPLRTTAGYLYRNGSPARLYVAGGAAISVMVLDSTQQQVSYTQSWRGVEDAAGATAAAAAQPYVDLAHQWATKTDGEVVTGEGYGAKKYAQDAETAQEAAELAEANAESARDSTFAASLIYTGTQAAAKTAGLAATASGNLFRTLAEFVKNSLLVWKDNAGVAEYQGTQAFGLGETAERIKAIEGATCDDWPVQPDILIDCLDMHKWDGRVLPNRMAASDPSKNLYPLNTGEIRLGTGNTGGTTTITIRADGNAMRVQFAGTNANSDQITFFNGQAIPAGTYKLVVALKSVAGKGAQNIQAFESIGSTTSSLTCDESGYVDRTFSFTATGAALTLRLRSLAAGTDFYIDKIRIFEDDGLTTPAWAVDNQGHVKDSHGTRGTFAADGLFIDTTNSALNVTPFPLSSFPDPTTITDITFVACAKVDDTTQDNVGTLVGMDTGEGVYGPTSGPRLGSANSSPEAYRYDGSLASYPDTLEYTRINLRGEGFQTFGVAVGASLVTKTFRQITYWRHNHSLGSFSARSLAFGGVGNASEFKGKVSQLAVFINRGGNGLTESQIWATEECMRQRLAARGKTLGSFRDVHFSNGDSRSHWSSSSPNGPGWNHQLAARNYFGSGLPSLKLVNLAWQSSILGTPGDTPVTDATPVASFAGTSLYARLALDLVAIQRAHALGLRVHWTHLCDINDSAAIIASGAAAYSTREIAYLTTIRDALNAGGTGSKLYLFTCTPLHTNAAFEAPRAALNTLRRAYSSTLITGGIIDVAADATLGTYSGTTAPTGYVDDKHWNGAGGAIAATLAKTAMGPNRLY